MTFINVPVFDHVVATDHAIARIHERMIPESEMLFAMYEGSDTQAPGGTVWRKKAGVCLLIDPTRHCLVTVCREYQGSGIDHGTCARAHMKARIKNRKAARKLQ